MKQPATADEWFAAIERAEDRDVALSLFRDALAEAAAPDVLDVIRALWAYADGRKRLVLPMRDSSVVEAATALARLMRERQP